MSETADPTFYVVRVRDGAFAAAEDPTADAWTFVPWRVAEMSGEKALRFSRASLDDGVRVRRWPADWPHAGPGRLDGWADILRHDGREAADDEQRADYGVVHFPLLTEKQREDLKRVFAAPHTSGLRMELIAGEDVVDAALEATHRDAAEARERVAKLEVELEVQRKRADDALRAGANAYDIARMALRENERVTGELRAAHGARGELHRQISDLKRTIDAAAALADPAPVRSSVVARLLSLGAVR